VGQVILAVIFYFNGYIPSIIDFIGIYFRTFGLMFCLWVLLGAVIQEYQIYKRGY